MKKLTLLAITAVFFSYFSQAQINKGSVLLGGGISAGTGKSESNGSENKYSSVGFSPSIGLAVKENKVVGLRLSYSRSKTEPFSNNSQTQIGYSTGVFYRRYFPLSSAFLLFGEGAVYYSSQRADYENTNPNQKSRQTNRGVGLNLYPGIAYAASKRFHLELGLNNLISLDYNKSKSENLLPTQGANSEGSSFSFSTNLSAAAPLVVGFRFVLGK